MSDKFEPKYFRAEKINRNHDDYKVLVVGLVIGICIMLFTVVSGRLIEYRWYRDVAHLTPFSKVVLLETHVLEGNSVLVMNGTMRKDRCEFDFSVDNNPIGYVTGQYNQRHRVPVDTSPEDIKTGVVKQSRPPGSNIESWGPWTIDVTDLTVFDEPLKPKSFEVVVFHNDCPTKPVSQVNTFVEGNWGEFISQRPETNQ